MLCQATDRQWFLGKKISARAACVMCDRFLGGWGGQCCSLWRSKPKLEMRGFSAAVTGRNGGRRGAIVRVVRGGEGAGESEIGGWRGVHPPAG